MRRFVLASLFCALLIPGVALADITVGLNPTITGGPSVFTWSYDVTLNGNETATSVVPGGGCSDTTTSICGGTFFTIYDVRGLMPGSESAPSGWAVSAQLVGLTPNGQTPDTGDSASIPNLTFYYTGPQITGPQDLGTFSFQSTTDIEALGSYTQQSNSNPPGFREHGGGFTYVPASAVVATPEPSSLLLIGAALICLAIGRKRLSGLAQES